MRLGDVHGGAGGGSTDSSGLLRARRLNATPVGNPLVIVKRLNELLPGIKQNLPPGTMCRCSSWRASSARPSTVIHTLMEAIIIVVAVIFLCLGSLRAC